MTALKLVLAFLAAKLFILRLKVRTRRGASVDLTVGVLPTKSGHDADDAT